MTAISLGMDCASRVQASLPAAVSYTHLFNRYIIVTVRCHIFFSQRDKTRVLRCKDKNSAFLQQFINLSLIHILRQTLRKALATAASFDEFSSLLLQEGVTVKESRGTIFTKRNQVILWIFF